MRKKENLMLSILLIIEIIFLFIVCEYFHIWFKPFVCKFFISLVGLSFFFQMKLDPFFWLLVILQL